jgi:sarcosine oxidase
VIEKDEIVVIGLGAMGAATLYQLARRGVPAIGIDRFAPPHALGSSHGETRITRLGVGEGDAYVPLAKRSHVIWRALEAETGADLLHEVGFLVIKSAGDSSLMHGLENFLARSEAIATRHDIPHAVIDAAEISRRFPGFKLHGDETVYFEPGGGYVHPERCIATQLRLAEGLGATILRDRRVTRIGQSGNTVEIETDAGRLEAGQAIISAGAWAGPLLGPPFDRLLIPYRQVLHWFPVDPTAKAAAEGLPTYIWSHGSGAEDNFYGFPALPGTSEMKVATENYAMPAMADIVDRTVAPAEGAAMWRHHIDGRFRSMARTPVRSATCLYTVTPDHGFVVDRHPEQDRLIVVSPCSGHGFKHSAALGEAVAEWAAEGRSAIDLGPFALSRLL